MKIVIIYASEGDKAHVDKITHTLDELSVPYDLHMASAHKVPEMVLEILAQYHGQHHICYITIAGRSNGLSGVVAGNTAHPVIACPPFSDKADYAVNIHSSLQMPSETPAMVVIDPGNAALAAARILGIGYQELQHKLAQRVEKVKQNFKK